MNSSIYGVGPMKGGCRHQDLLPPFRSFIRSFEGLPEEFTEEQRAETRS